MKDDNYLRMWVDIDTVSLRQNVRQIRRVLSPGSRLMAVVKSNAYGHGLVEIAKRLASMDSSLVTNNQLLAVSNQLPVISNRQLWFGVDSLVEGVRLRREGIKNPILVLGATLSEWFAEAARQDIILTISTSESLVALAKLQERPAFHIKIDTGMYRQGFLTGDIPHLIKTLMRFKLVPHGVYTHFAAAKDRTYPAFTLRQFDCFQKAASELRRAGFKKLVRHAAASGATILFPETHCDMVRVGMALWGHWPSEEARMNVDSGVFRLPRITLHPVLSWRAKVSEVKKIPKGAVVGYDATEQVVRPTSLAIVPVGYWHGLDRGLSSVGSALIRGRRAKILGRISMDMTVCDVTDIAGVKAGDTATFIGKDGSEEVTAGEIARHLNTSSYEVLTRLNPLVKRIYR